jgi:hypothetical protein
MGLYDWIENRLWCPYCGAKLKRGDFQTKSFGSDYVGKHLVLPMDSCRGGIRTIYAPCSKCHSWIELMVGEDSVRRLPPPKQKKISRKVL